MLGFLNLIALPGAFQTGPKDPLEHVYIARRYFKRKPRKL
jgi:hypothetical protein